MKTTTLLTATAVVAGLIATPVLAKDRAKHHAKVQSGYSTQMSDNGYVGQRYYDQGYRDRGYRNDMRRSDTGFWPTDVAAGAVGGAFGLAGAAVDTAGAIATAPFRPWNNNAPWDNSRPWDNMRSNIQSGTWGSGTWDNSYAYYNGPVDRYDARDAYARRNNFVCQPGTWFRGEGGQRQLCQ